MITRELVTKLYADLSNLSEKTQGNYIDHYFEDNEIPDEYKKIAEKGAKQITEYEYINNEHPMLPIDESICNSVGLDGIHIYAYPEQDFKGGFIIEEKESNFIYWPNGNYLDIDVYNCKYKDSEEIYDNIIDELMNFERDAKWVVENGAGFYNSKLEEMKTICETLRPKYE